MEAKYSKWRKLDNAALAFPMVTGKDDTRVFRFYCELKETVDETTLQEALDQTMKTYPLFQADAAQGIVLVLSGTPGDPAGGAGGDEAAVQQAVYPG